MAQFLCNKAFYFEVIDRAMFVEKEWDCEVNNLAVSKGNAFYFYVSNFANLVRKSLSFGRN